MFVISTTEDSIYLNLQSDKKEEIDIDVRYNIGMIREITYDPIGKNFYILCNNYNEKLGVYIFSFRED